MVEHRRRDRPHESRRVVNWLVTSPSRLTEVHGGGLLDAVWFPGDGTIRAVAGWWNTVDVIGRTSR
ncbi:hypothetical protein, partial [Actinophytocola sp. KF-1]